VRAVRQGLRGRLFRRLKEGFNIATTLEPNDVPVG
jgi:hypothetical protein